MAKLFILPHLPAAIGFRSHGAFAAAVAHQCTGRSFDTFDALLGELPSILRFADVMTPAHLRDSRFPDVELVAVGWSQQQGRMLGRLFAKRGADEEFSAKDTQGCIAPFVADMMSDIPTTAESLAPIARAQVRFLRGVFGLGGGRLVVAQLTRESVFLNHAMTFDAEEEPYADSRPAA